MRGAGGFQSVKRPLTRTAPSLTVGLLTPTR